MAPTPKPTSRPVAVPDPTPQPTPSPTSNPTPNPINQPTPNTTPNPTTKPTPGPTGTGGNACCAERNSGYQVCSTNPWCNENETQCGNCAGKMMEVPLVRTGCCSWGGADCSGYDPTTNYGCHYLQSDCEGSCGGVWQPF